MALLFLAYGLVLAAFAAALFWLILKAYRGRIDVPYDEYSLDSEYESNGNVIDLSAFQRADMIGLRLLQEYSQIESSNLPEKDKLREILLWNQKLQEFEVNNRRIIQSRGFLKPVQLQGAKSPAPTEFTRT
ncbi:hypothetical protein [Kangiella aquimarina]|uniref:Uncharacterized protein n=1 Tax=Kangiella aquimarina TaxID=261965 RepID=A0ABZ0X363_9GAMM|nr:hypothetical protein [Kangiella aquimarina]WQG84819.1 hypothetical protein SR900_10140 [Kangiella aquimarina]